MFWGGFFLLFVFFFPFREVFSFPEKTFPCFLRFCFFSSGPKKAKKKAKGASGGTPGTPRGGVRPPVAPLLLLAWGSIVTETTHIVTDTPLYHDREHHIVVETLPFLLLDLGDSQSREKGDPHILTGALYHDRNPCIAIRTHYHDGIYLFTQIWGTRGTGRGRFHVMIGNPFGNRALHIVTGTPYCDRDTPAPHFPKAPHWGVTHQDRGSPMSRQGLSIATGTHILQGLCITTGPWIALKKSMETGPPCHDSAPVL